MTLEGKNSKYNCCKGSFQKTSKGVDSMAVIGRLEVEYIYRVEYS